MKYTDNEYKQRDYDELKAFYNELNTIGSKYKFDFIEDPTLDRREKVVLTGLIPVVARPKDYKKVYSFSLWHELKYIDWNDYKKVEQNYKKPNEIGVLNAKKVNDWIDYLIKIYEDLVKISQEKQERVATFLQEAKEAGIKVLKDTKEYHSESIKGDIVKNGLQFNFKIDNRNGYISKELRLHYSVANTLEAFKMLSSNEYKA